MTSEHVSTIRVRYADTDQMRVVHHANYLAYMEEARTVMLEELGSSYADFERSGFGLAVRRVEIRYRAPARYGESVCVRTCVPELRKASVLFSYRIESALQTGAAGPERSGAAARGRILAEGSTELACISLDDMRPRPLPTGLCELLRPFVPRDA